MDGVADTEPAPFGVWHLWGCRLALVGKGLTLDRLVGGPAMVHTSASSNHRTEACTCVLEWHSLWLP